MRAAEHARMGGHAAEVVRALVVHLAANETAAARIDLRRRDAIEQRGRRSVHRLRHLERLEHVVVQIRVERLTAHLLDESPEHVRADVAVHHDSAGQRVERRREHQLGEAVRVVRDLVVGLERRQTRRVRQQVADRDALLVRSCPRRDVPLERSVEIDAMLLDELHHRARNAQHFRQRRDVPQRVLVRRRTGFPVQVAHRILGDDAIARPNDGDGIIHRMRMAALETQSYAY